MLGKVGVGYRSFKSNTWYSKIHSLLGQEMIASHARVLQIIVVRQWWLVQTTSSRYTFLKICDKLHLANS